MQPLTAFLTRLNPLVPGCPEPMALQALLDSAIAFCEETTVVRSVTDVDPLKPGVAEYDIDLPPSQDLVRVLGAWRGPWPLNRRSDAAPQDPFLAPYGVRVASPTSVLLNPAPVEGVTDGLQLLIATKPQRTSTQVDDALYNDWVEAIAGGATARIAVVPGQTFTSADMVAYGAAQYAAGASKAKLEAEKARVRSSLSVAARHATMNDLRRRT